jgi:glycosyltransferase involved in cell wall biosynthesis
VLYICIPTYNEAPTIGVLLWRIRTVFQEYSREYEIVVYDDGSTDATAETLAPYAKVMPLTVIGGEAHRGYAAAVDALVRAVAARTKYPRRDAMILMQGDFTDQPEQIPELVKRFEGGADVVVGERPALLPSAPKPVQQLRRAVPWLLRPFVGVSGVADLTSSYRLVRIQVLRDLLKAMGDAPVVTRTGWAANAELLLRVVPLARRVEAVTLPPRHDVRPRASRVRLVAEAKNVARFGWASRGQRVTTLPPSTRPTAVRSPGAAGSAPAAPAGSTAATAAGPLVSAAASAPPRPTARPDA